MNENRSTSESHDMHVGIENGNRVKRHSMPASPKVMLSRTPPRTPLGDVLNKCGPRARGRVSTGSVKYTVNENFKYRMDTIDQLPNDYASVKVKFFKEQKEGSKPIQQDENTLHENLSDLVEGADAMSVKDNKLEKEFISTSNQDIPIQEKITSVECDGNSVNSHLLLEASGEIPLEQKERASEEFTSNPNQLLQEDENNLHQNPGDFVKGTDTESVQDDKGKEMVISTSNQDMSSNEENTSVECDGNSVKPILPLETSGEIPLEQEEADLEEFISKSNQLLHSVSNFEDENILHEILSDLVEGTDAMLMQDDEVEKERVVSNLSQDFTTQEEITSVECDENSMKSLPLEEESGEIPLEHEEGTLKEFTSNPNQFLHNVSNFEDENTLHEVLSDLVEGTDAMLMPEDEVEKEMVISTSNQDMSILEQTTSEECEENSLKSLPLEASEEIPLEQEESTLEEFTFKSNQLLHVSSFEDENILHEILSDLAEGIDALSMSDDEVEKELAISTSNQDLSMLEEITSVEFEENSRKSVHPSEASGEISLEQEEVDLEEFTSKPNQLLHSMSNFEDENILHEILSDLMESSDAMLMPDDDVEKEVVISTSDQDLSTQEEITSEECEENSLKSLPLEASGETPLEQKERASEEFTPTPNQRLLNMSNFEDESTLYQILSDLLKGTDAISVPDDKVGEEMAISNSSQNLSTPEEMSFPLLNTSVEQNEKDLEEFTSKPSELLHEDENTLVEKLSDPGKGTDEMPMQDYKAEKEMAISNSSQDMPIQEEIISVECDGNSVNSILSLEASEEIPMELSGNKLSGEVQHEIKHLEYLVLEMRQKVERLESQVQNNQGENGSNVITEEDDGPNQSKIEALEVELGEERLKVNDLQAQLNERKKKVDELEVQLVEERLKCGTLQGYADDAEKRCSALEKERLSSELNFAKELQRLKSELAQSICHQQKDLDESVQVAYGEFEGMMSEVDRLTMSQSKLKDMLDRVIKTTSGSVAGYAKVLGDYSKLQQSHQSMTTKLSATETDNKKLNDDVQEMENLLQRSNDSLNELHRLYMEADQTSQDELKHMSTKVASLSEALEKATQEKTRLEKCLEDYSQKCQQSLDRLENECQSSQEELKDSVFLLDHQKQKNQTLTEEVVKLQKVKTEWESGKSLIKELTDEVSFLNEERKAVTLEYNNKLEVAMDKARNMEDSMKSLMLANEEYESSQDMLQTEISGLKEELHLKEADVNSILSSLEQVECRADSLLDTLQLKFGLDLSCDSNKATPKSLPVSDSSKPLTTFPGTSSLVAQILSRAGEPCSNTLNQTLSTAKEKNFQKQSNVEYGSCSKQNTSSSQSFSVSRAMKTSPGPSSRKALRFSSPCAESHSLSVQATTSAHEEEENRLNTSIPGFARVRSIPLSANRSKDRSCVTSYDGSKDLNVVDTYETLVAAIDGKFSHILKIAHVADRVSRNSVRKLKNEVEVLSEKLQTKDRCLEKLEAEFETKRHLLDEARDEVVQLNERVNKMTQAILQQEDLRYDVKRMEEDNSDLKLEICNLKGEKDLLSNQVQDLISKVGSGTDSQASLKRIATLEKKNYELYCFMFQEKEQNKEKGEKAKRRMRVLESNLKMAENEVYKFDELVEAIRNTCIENRSSSIHTHPVLLHIVRLIDGLVEVEKKPRDRSGATSSQSSVKSKERKEFPV